MIRRGAPRAANGGARGQRGAVTAETAVALPAVVVVAAVVVAVGQAAAAHLQCVDAARAAARLAARGESPGLVRARAVAAAPPGATVTVASSAGQVTVRVSAVAVLPLGLAVPVEGTSTADAEPGWQAAP